MIDKSDATYIEVSAWVTNQLSQAKKSLESTSIEKFKHEQGYILALRDLSSFLNPAQPIQVTENNDYLR